MLAEMVDEGNYDYHINYLPVLMNDITIQESWMINLESFFLSLFA
jgi:hypothetical protein